MHQKERIKIITDILKKHGFVTVKFLTDELHYSTATINRDLNVMQNQRLIKRSYGGVELNKARSYSMVFRYNKMRPVKNKIAKKAAEFINDGDTIFIDGSTTTQYIGRYITEKKDITVITNNLALATFLSEYNINVICLGGTIADPPSIVCSAETVEYAIRYRADKMFFSTGAVTDDGKIQSVGFYYLMLLAMRENSDKAFLLIDHEKINRPCKQFWGDFSKVDYIISDYRFSDKIKSNFDTTDFIEID